MAAGKWEGGGGLLGGSVRDARRDTQLMPIYSLSGLIWLMMHTIARGSMIGQYPTLHYQNVFRSLSSCWPWKIGVWFVFAKHKGESCIPPCNSLHVHVHVCICKCTLINTYLLETSQIRVI